MFRVKPRPQPETCPRHAHTHMSHVHRKAWGCASIIRRVSPWRNDTGRKRLQSVATQFCVWGHAAHVKIHTSLECMSIRVHKNKHSILFLRSRWTPQVTFFLTSWTHVDYSHYKIGARIIVAVNLTGKCAPWRASSPEKLCVRVCAERLWLERDVQVRLGSTGSHMSFSDGGNPWRSGRESSTGDVFRFGRFVQPAGVSRVRRT